MDSFLLYPEKNISGETPYPSFQDIYKDLNLNIVLKTMSQNDAFMMEQIKTVMMVPVRTRDDLEYRYAVIKDFSKNQELMDELYELGKNGFQLADQYKREREQNRSKATFKTSSIISALNFIADSTALLQKIKDELQKKEVGLQAEGLVNLRDRICRYPLDEFRDFHNKILFYIMGGEAVFSIHISGGLKLESSRLCDCSNYRQNSLKGTSLKLAKLYYKVLKKDTMVIEDEALEKDINLFVESNMFQVVETYHPLIENFISFFYDFSREISFYKGIQNIQNRMNALDLPLCYGKVCEDNTEKDIENLYELSLALYTQKYPIPNSLKNKEKVLTVITGANQGGKSTFLRSFGIAQVMMQCGMPVPAKSFSSGLYSRIHTHFTRKEDAMLSRGRLEEELKRMSNIVSQLAGDSLVLLNESFASTTEKEGSQIAGNIIMPLYHKGIQVMMVTHLHEFAKSLYEKELDGAEFLVAERRENGERTYHMLRGKPHYSSYGTDLYEYMIGNL